MILRMCIVYVLVYVIRLHKLSAEPVQKYRLIETIDWTHTFTDTVNPTEFVRTRNTPVIGSMS